MAPFASSAARPLILVVDDDAMQRFLYREALEPHGFDVIEAVDGQSAVSAFSEVKPSLVLLDVVMPDIDGYTACRMIRALDSGSIMPILMATGLDDFASVEASYEAGATDFIPKPVNWALLPHRVRYLLRSHDTLRRFIRSEQNLEEAQRIATVGNFDWPADERLLFASPEAGRIFGFETIPGRPVALRSVLRRIPSADRSRLLNAFRHLDESAATELDMVVVSPGGETRHVSIRAELDIGPVGQRLIRGTCQDVTERKRGEIELQVARDRALAGDAAKTAFLAAMSHELRTPLNAIIGFGELIAAPGFTPVSDQKQKEFASRILLAARHMLHSFEDVLMIAQLLSGAYRLNAEPWDLSVLVEAAVTSFKQAPEANGRSISLTSSGSPVEAVADPMAVKRMLHKLLSNAVKFSPPESSVLIEVSQPQHGCPQIVVQDFGIGMSDEEVALAQEPFRQVDQRLARKFEGMGLGLSISKHLIEVAGGQMEIISAPGEGTRVILNFPIASRDDQVEIATLHPVSISSLRQPGSPARDRDPAWQVAGGHPAFRGCDSPSLRNPQ